MTQELMDKESLEQLKALIDKIKSTDSPDGLSKALVELASIRFYVGGLVSSAESEYSKKVIHYLSQSADLEESTTDAKPFKKMTVAEAERRADADTECNKDKLRYRLESIDELLNAGKLRARILAGEKGIAEGGSNFA